ncbi:hypothetical protein ZYGR_0S02570 [Zygosaccharomyces rouxii]|uniref:ZYRO0F08250p n=2 Tax=Zygosaccharomyces rouxii TaxID=4956 RepID=C5DXW2_ZYGRC|nr:uncharacterized protein ZYRO0F08250g [Zygosaccharomyces rouxii]KAH9199381.1 hypothetical protein LQ764DRAFT_129575 [Zygosaccharomyces rouxii]GAV50123.1 hypothetical protein ZYGR_0S02570 [Zygosaccharomyces rouxii]CAR28623.1 ZYRO0F08250p [Zygosaccharomyces rouxii]
MNVIINSAGNTLYRCPLVGKKLLLTPGPLNILISKYSTVNNEKNSSSRNQNQNQQDRLHKIIAKSKILSKLNQNPRFASYFARLSDAGVTSTVTSFLILHEFTAIVPLFGLWYIFYQLDLPEQYELPLYFTDLLNRCGDAMEKLVGDKYASDLDHNRLILAGAISYSIVKLLYPIRVFASLWGAPYVGRWILSPFRRIRSKYAKKGEKSAENFDG